MECLTAQASTAATLDACTASCESTVGCTAVQWNSAGSVNQKCGLCGSWSKPPSTKANYILYELSKLCPSTLNSPVLNCNFNSCNFSFLISFLNFWFYSRTIIMHGYSNVFCKPGSITVMMILMMAIKNEPKCFYHIFYKTQQIWIKFGG